MFLQKIIFKHFLNYPTIKSLTYSYVFGSLISLFMILQIITGFILTFYYIPHVNLALSSVDLITNELSAGWFIRYVHMNIASFLFIGIYCHMSRSLYLKLYFNQKKNIWFTGYLLYILLVVISFLGYVLPWGQMSFWRTTIITKLIAVVPWGERLVELIWGNVSVSDSTLRRFFILHYILPFILSIVIILHLYWIHSQGTTTNNTVTDLTNKKNLEGLGKIFLIKDLIITISLILLLFLLVCVIPYFFANPVNEINANFMAAPEHILPEWYFLPFYGILKFIPNKLMGIGLMFVFILAPVFLPILPEINLVNIKNIKLNLFYFNFTPIFNINFKFYVIVGSYIFFAISACFTIFNVEMCSLILILYFLVVFCPTFKIIY